MPHQCTSCGRAFEDGSKEMLSGCPDCGGNKFQFMPAGAIDGNDGNETGMATTPKKAPEDSPSADAPETGGTHDDLETTPSETRGDERASAVNRAASTVREWVGRGDPDHGRSNDRGRDDAPRPNDGSAESDPTDGPATESVHEDSAQASARTDVVSKSELPDATPSADSAATPTSRASRTASDSQLSTDAHDDGNVVDAPADQNPGLKELREELNSQFESIRIVNPGQYELNLMELYEREEYIISLQEDGKYVIEVPDAWDGVDR